MSAVSVMCVVIVMRGLCLISQSLTLFNRSNQNNSFGVMSVMSVVSVVSVIRGPYLIT